MGGEALKEAFLLETLKKLEQVQELDIQIDSALRKRAEFPVRVKKFNDDIAEIEVKLTEKKKLIDELQKNKRQQTGALELNEERSRRSQEKLESIKNSQEFSALQKEIDSLKKNSAVIEENAKKIDEELTKLTTECSAYESQIAEIKARLNDETGKISSEEKTIEQDLEKLQEVRKSMVVDVDRRLLASYDRIRGGKGGIGIAIAAGGCCKGCNMRLPPQLYIQIQRPSEVELCPSCRRILIFKDVPKVSA